MAKNEVFPYGVTFYPDLWPQDSWEDNFRRIAKAGFNIVRFGEMAWNWVQPQEDVWRFKELDKALKIAYKHGLKVLLGLATSQAPMWLMRKHPQILPVAEDGTIYPPYGPRPNVCRDVPEYKKAVEKYLAVMVERYQDNPAVAMWQIDNEPVYPPLDSTTLRDFCHCPATRASFIAWAQKKYKTIANLNKQWGTRFWTVEFGDWDDIQTPRGGFCEAGNPHIFLDWMRFKTDQLHDWTLWLKEVVRRRDPVHRLGTNGFIGICTRVPEHEIMAEGLDWYGWDFYPRGVKADARALAQGADFWRSTTVGKNTEFHVTELQGGNNVRWGYPGNVEGPEIKLWVHQMVAHGAKAILFHQWRAPLFGSETGGFGLLDLEGRATQRLAAAEQAGREIAAIAPRLEGYELKPKVAIAFLRSAEVQTYQEQGNPRASVGQWESVSGELGISYTLDSYSGAYRILWPQYTPADVVFDRQLAKGLVSKSNNSKKAKNIISNVGNKNGLLYEALILINPYILSDKQVDNLLDYVRRGGILITECRFGLKDERAWLRPRPALLRLLPEAKYERTEIIEGKLNFSLGGKTAGRKTGKKDSGLIGPVAGYRDILKTNKGVIARFDDGHPAIIRRKYGRGEIIYCTFSIGLTIQKMPAVQAGKFIDLIRGSLPGPIVDFQASGEVEVIPWQKGDKICLYLINQATSPQRIKIKKPAKAEIVLKPGEAKLAEI